MTAPVSYRPPVIYRPDSAVFWVFVAAVGVGAVTLLNYQGPALRETLDANLALAPLWTAFAAFLVWLLLRFDPFRAMRPYPQILAAGSALGATAAVAMAMQGNAALQALWAGLLPPEVLAAWSPALTAPIIEEAAKLMCAAVLLVLCAAVVTRPAHALLVGMFVGLGFDLMEDLGYASNAAIASLDSDVVGAGGSLAVRAFTAIPAHWSYTSLTTVGLLLLLRRQRPAAALGLLAAGPVMHFVWNAPVPDEHAGVLLLGKVTGTLVVYLVIVFALLRLERRWVCERIATAPPAGVRPEVLDSLPTARRRRALRRAARRSGGRAAARAVRAEQRAALDLLQRG
ncbi:PrsW family intramembrane metalloprotease [uncultured Mycolicibacterium sp.]|uniref:PrsW family intramembrane metalloprotease n=1 Tax=uncultured Mycolicibacterium sp. TaxID=2320817 RepID=UPI002632EAB8|nr:PrsW family intramembrane metalloprotease [uncultured Mycolicibacterium sp.]